MITVATKTCPFCGSVKEDGKRYRLAIFIRDQRVAIFDPDENLRLVAKKEGLSVYGYLRKIVRDTPNSYLMQEILNNNDEIVSSKQVGESTINTLAESKTVK